MGSVLVIEANAELASSLATALVECALTVERDSSAADAVARLRLFRYAAVVCGPGLGDEAVSSVLEAIERCAYRPPVFLSSTSADVSSIARAIARTAGTGVRPVSGSPSFAAGSGVYERPPMALLTETAPARGTPGPGLPPSVPVVTGDHLQSK